MMYLSTTVGLTGEYLNIFLAGVLGMLLLAIALVGFFVTYQRRLFRQERLRQEEAAAHQKQLLIASVEAQEEERGRIASDLHDDIGSLLTATRLYLRQLPTDSTEKRVASVREKSLGIVDDMITNTRRISHNLLPPALEKFGFQAATEDLCDRMNDSAQVAITFATQTDDRLPAKAEIALYRVVQELLNNSLKHAEAATITVTFRRVAKAFELVYADDGKGFDLSQTRANGLGLHNVETRVMLEGGALTWNTAPGQGLTVTAVLPGSIVA